MQTIREKLGLSEPKEEEPILFADEITAVPPEAVPSFAWPNPLLLDLGCGRNKRKDKPFLGVDSINYPEVDVTCDLRQQWPWDDNSVTEVHCSHFVEHLTALERVHFANELWRVLKPGAFVNGNPSEGFATIITPHWCSARAYGDFTHQWPPVSEWWYLYLDRAWRLGDPAQGRGPNAPHCDFSFNPDGYKCNFDCQVGGIFHPELASRNDEFKTMASKWAKEAFTDTQAIIVKRL